MSFNKNLLFEGIEIRGEIKLLSIFSLEDFDSNCVFKVPIVNFPNMNGLLHLRIPRFDDHLCKPFSLEFMIFHVGFPNCKRAL